MKKYQRYTENLIFDSKLINHFITDQTIPNVNNCSYFMEPMQINVLYTDKHPRLH